MEVYLYCSYSGAQQGFTLSRVEPKGAVPVSLLSQEPPEKLIRDFFFFDRFRILWLEYPLSVGGILSGPTGALFGMRSLNGQLEGRGAVANFMIHACREDLPQLEPLARAALSAPADFTRQLFTCLQLGGPCGYTADPQAISELLRFSFPGAAAADAAAAADPAPDTEPNAATAPAASDTDTDTNTAAADSRDKEASPGTPLDLVSASMRERGRMNPRTRLRFAVYLTTWEDAIQGLSAPLLWRMKPSQALSEKEYLGKFGVSF